MREFENDALLLSQVQHKNVVTLYNYYAHGDDKLLIYEYAPNESLDKLLFSSRPSDQGRVSPNRFFAPSIVRADLQIKAGPASKPLFVPSDCFAP
ncbi:hypothetical protein ZIOFF_035301 [Zingiber officinale]|uniref:Serine-threonine/tyrosine-protein kinase catalytic domain-containing protein n=1 Tax=Zingiber officinale TaxID=94328 RepID=A0A8J5GME7_ZINOF|nr:hypothetical protein ZIOFF_035301 [Zingiber officinale]